MKTTKKSRKQSQKAIYNCHIHTFTFKNSPPHLYRLFLEDPLTGKKNLWRFLPLIFIAVFAVFLTTVGIPLLIKSGFQSVIHDPYYPYSWLVYLALPVLLVVEAGLISAVAYVVLVISRLAFRILMVAVISKKEKLSPTEKMYQSALSQTIMQVSGQTSRLQAQLRSVAIYLPKILPGTNDMLERYARFLSTSVSGSQYEVFKKIQDQYPNGTKFIVLPMNLDLMGESVGMPLEYIHKQHEELLDLTECVNTEARQKKQGNVVFPFYTVHPEQKNFEEIVGQMERGEIFIGKKRSASKERKFYGLKIYPNLGYFPTHERLKNVYRLCQKNNVPVMTHCTPYGIWKSGITEEERKAFGHPAQYQDILKAYPNLRICLAHFGGSEEWVKRIENPKDNTAWGYLIYKLLQSGKYPNLYTDISYTVFDAKIKNLTIDLIDYLKVMLESDKHVREHVLFGSDYYMIEQEKISEKEIAILLRSRLGDKLFFQIAHTNPKRYLGIA